MRIHSLKTALVTLALASGVAHAEEVAQVAAASDSYVPVNFAFAPLVELNAGYTRPTNAFSLGVLGGTAATTEGVAVSGIVQVNTRDVRGAQVSGVAGWTGGTVSGLQMAGVAAVAEKAQGAQVAGVMNLAKTDVAGLQLGGTINFAGGTVRGAQISGVLNYAAEVDGAQITGAVNVAGKLRGLQLGIVNVADEVDGGITLGLINIVRKDGLHNVGVWSSDTSVINVGTRLGTDRFYSILSAGVTPAATLGSRDSLEKREADYSVGGGFGTRARLNQQLSIGAELMSFYVARGAVWDSLGDNLQKLQVVANWSPVRGVTFFGGPALNGLYSRDGHALSDVGMIAGFERFELNDSASWELGLGFSAGVQFF